MITKKRQLHTHTQNTLKTYLKKKKKKKRGENKHREPKKPIQIYDPLNNKTPNDNNGIMRTVITIIIV